MHIGLQGRSLCALDQIIGKKAKQKHETSETKNLSRSIGKDMTLSSNVRQIARFQIHN